MPAKCDHCGQVQQVYACQACRRKLSAESKPKPRSPIRHCQDCGVWKGGKFVIAKPRRYCRECLEARGVKLEVIE